LDDTLNKTGGHLMKYKYVFLGVIFNMIVMAIEETLKLKRLSLLIPATFIIVLFAFIRGKLKNQSK